MEGSNGGGGLFFLFFFLGTASIDFVSCKMRCGNVEWAAYEAVP